jgi:hypothetical protein
MLGRPARDLRAVVGCGEASLGNGNEGQAVLSEGDRSCRAREERRAELIFELLDALAEGGWGERHDARRATKIAGTRGL